MGEEEEEEGSELPLQHTLFRVCGDLQLEVLIRQLVTGFWGSELEMGIASSAHSLWLKLQECLSSPIGVSTEEEAAKEKRGSPRELVVLYLTLAAKGN